MNRQLVTATAAAFHFQSMHDAFKGDVGHQIVTMNVDGTGRTNITRPNTPSQAAPAWNSRRPPRAGEV